MRWAFFDASWLGHRARLTMKGLSGGNHIIFGVLNQILATCNDRNVATNRIAVFFDSKKSVREQAYPEYKRQRARERTDEEWAEIQTMQDQLAVCRTEVFPAMGVPVYRQTGLESDDVMAQAAIQARGDGAVLVTGDGDLYQCITDNVVWYDPGRNLLMDEAGLQKAKRVGPNDWALVKAMCGCDSDNVEGITGVGEKTAVDHLWKLLKPGSKRYESIMSKEGQAVIKRNLPLVKLPHATTKPIELSSPSYNAEAFFAMAKSLGLNSFLDNRRHSWEAFFRGVSGEAAQTTRKRGETR